jgi:glucose/arabinose dehydrogenase
MPSLAWRPGRLDRDGQGRLDPVTGKKDAGRRRFVACAGQLAAALAISVTLAACTAGGAQPAPTWVPQPGFQDNGQPQPELPAPAVPQPQPSAPGSAVPQPSVPTGEPNQSPSSGSSSAADPTVVATKLNQPTGLVVLPDGTALVGERTTGHIYRVLPTPGNQPVLVQTLSGVDGSGDGGLLDMALSPTYEQDNLIYAYVTTSTDNRVIQFSIGAPPTVVVSGIPRGTTGNAGRIAFDGTGALLIGTGDAGNAALAQSRSSLAGKVLRTTDIGRPAPGNPQTGSIIFASGFHTIDALCVDPTNGMRIAISAAIGDQISLLRAGADYGYPRPASGSASPSGRLPAASSGTGSCVVAGGQLVTASSTGTELVTAALDRTGKPGAFSTALHGRYGRLRTVVAGSDGALWITTTNRDGHGFPVPDDDRVIRVSSAEVGTGSTL